MSVSNCCISQGSVATYLRCGGNYYTRFVGNFFLYTAVQEFLKSIKIWQSCRQSSGPQFFWDTVYLLTYLLLDNRGKREPELSMGWVDPRVGFGRVGSRFCSFRWFGSNMTKVLFFDDYTTYNCKGPWSKLNTRGMKNWRFSTNISLYFENGTRYGDSYNGRPCINFRQYGVSCIRLGWVGLGWVIENGPMDNSG